MSDDSEVALWRQASSDLLALVVDAEVTEMLGYRLERELALEALAARAELADRMCRHRWLAMEAARRAGAAWKEIDLTVGLPPGGSTSWCSIAKRPSDWWTPTGPTPAPPTGEPPHDRGRRPSPALLPICSLPGTSQRPQPHHQPRLHQPRRHHRHLAPKLHLHTRSAPPPKSRQTPLHRRCSRPPDGGGPAVMGVAKMSPDGWAYYAREIAEGGEDYFAGHGEEPGRWVGRGAAALGLAAEATPEQLASLFGQGCDPRSGAALGRGCSGGDQVAGWALSFSPPKSVSLVWALGDSAAASEVRSGHDAAVAAALAFLEDHAGFTRRGRGGAVQVDADGYVAAAFVHRTSRAGDPQLHTHVLVANKVRASSDGAWLTLDGREVFEAQRAAGMVYKAALRDELTRRLGVAWEPVAANGGGEITGVPAVLIQAFSTRRRQVEDAAGELITARQTDLGRSLTGGERAALYQLAVYRSRAAKAPGALSTAQLRARWRATAVEIGGTPEAWLGEVLAASKEPAVPSDLQEREGRGRVSAAPADADALEALETARSAWGRADVVETVSTLLVPAGREAGETREVIEAAADAVLADSQVVSLCLPAQPESPPGVLRRRDGLDPTIRHGQARYTTWATLATEQAVLEIAEQGRQAGAAVCPPATVTTALDGSGLGDDQAAAVERLCRAGERVGLLVGPAGSGKSRCLAAARQAWEAAGHRVTGVAPSTVAAGVLTGQAGIPADTLARWLAEAERRGPSGLGSGDVIVCDEASMVATRDLAALARAVEAADAKLVLVGDHRQLGAIEAGGLFRLLVSDHRAAELTGARRFHQAWEAAASRLLRAGDRETIERYDAHGRITASEPWEVLLTAFDAWHEAGGAGDTIVITAPDHDTVDAIANRIHAQRVAAGEVSPEGITVAGQTIGVRDEIVTLHNNRRLITSTGGWVRNGDRWTVRALRADGTAALTSLDGRGRVTVPADYLDEHVALAYAVTVHKAQGLTVDRAVTIVDERTTLEHLYVGMTRGRRTNHALVTTSARGDEHTETPARDARRVLESVLRRTGNEPSATELLRAALDAGQLDPGRLRAALAQARRAIDSAAGPDRRTTIARLAEQAGREAVAAQELVAAREELNRALAAQQRLQAAAPETIKAPAPPRQWWRRAPTPAAPRPLIPADELADAAGAVRTADEAVTKAERRVDGARAAAERLAEARATQTGRRQWLADHPEAVTHVQQLASLLAAVERHGQRSGSVLHHRLPTFRRPSRSTAQRSDSADE